jgi:caffeoyl-CoA O-methyltransferase
MAIVLDEPIEHYIRAHSLEEPPLFTALVKETHEKTAFPNMQSGHIEGTLLRLLIQISGAKRVLEVGTFTGYSALVMAHGLPDSGELITLDVDPHATEIAQRYWAQNPHGKKIKLMMGPALESIAKLSAPFDLVFIDADKNNYINYWEACMPLVRTGGLILVDNVLWSGTVLDPKDDHGHHIVAFNKHAASDARAEKLILTIRDGVTLARKL